MSVQSEAGGESKARRGRVTAPRSGGRWLRLLLASVLLGSAVAAVPAPAQAAGTFTTSDGVLYQTCVEHPVSYAVTPGSGNWMLSLTSTRSDGSEAPFVHLSSAMGDQPSGTTTLDFCAYPGTEQLYRPGRYTLAGELRWVDSGGVFHTEPLPSVTFTMAKPDTRTTFTISDRTPRPGQPIRYTVKVQLESPTGWTRLPLLAGALRLRVVGRVPGEKKFTFVPGDAGFYDLSGTWSQKYRWLGTWPHGLFRAETRGNDRVGASTSKVVHVITAYRGGGG